MKKNLTAGLVLALLLLLPGLPAAAQVRFETASTDSVRQLARQQHKLVFIDLYATWCPPCRMMERQVFAKPEVSAFMDAHFVAAKYDVDRPTGRKLMETYGRGAIPLYLVFDTEGTLWGSIEGASSAEVFVETLQSVVDRYRAGQL